MPKAWLRQTPSEDSFGSFARLLWRIPQETLLGLLRENPRSLGPEFFSNRRDSSGNANSPLREAQELDYADKVDELPPPHPQSLLTLRNRLAMRMMSPMPTARIPFNQFLVRLKRPNTFLRSSSHALPSRNGRIHCQWRETKKASIARLWRPHLGNNAHDLLQHLAKFCWINRSNLFLDDTGFSSKHFVRTDV